MPVNTAFIYSDKFGSVTYGEGHPMRPERLKDTVALASEFEILALPWSSLVDARKATEEEILLVHTRQYLDILKASDDGLPPPGAERHGLGYGDNPVFEGVYEWSSYSAGASVQCAELIGAGVAQSAFNIAGGLHHAMPARASGFCYLNDPAIAIAKLVADGKRVAYVDIDAHHGDGVERIFYESDKVLTISMHESGDTLFPGTGRAEDTGLKEGRGFAVNLPLKAGTGDGLFVEAFKELVPEIVHAFEPDVLVTQLGVDTFATDPLTHLNLTTHGFEELVKSFRSMALPWIALGGGGYDMSNVVRGWTLAWAIINGIEDDCILLEKIRDGGSMKPLQIGDDVKGVRRMIKGIKGEVLPIIKARRGVVAV